MLIDFNNMQEIEIEQEHSIINDGDEDLVLYTVVQNR